MHLISFLIEMQNLNCFMDSKDVIYQSYKQGIDLLKTSRSKEKHQS